MNVHNLKIRPNYFKAVSTGDNFVILTKLDGSVKTFDRNIIKHIRMTKLYEGG